MTSENTTISDISIAMLALETEMEEVERQQLQIAANIYRMYRSQAALSAKFRALKEAFGKLQLSRA